VIAIAFFFSSSSIPKGVEGITAGTAHYVGTGLVSFYILFIVAIVAAVYSEVSKLFK